MINELIPMTEFVKLCDKRFANDGLFDSVQYREIVSDYAQFISQEVTISMFVKYDKEEDVLFKGWRLCDNSTFNFYKREYTVIVERVDNPKQCIMFYKTGVHPYTKLEEYIKLYKLELIKEKYKL